MASTDAIVRELLDRKGTTFASQAGIDLQDTPMPLFRLLTLSLLLATERNSEYGMEAVQLLDDAGIRTSDTVLETSHDDLSHVLNEAKYARRIHQHTDRLKAAAERVEDRWSGDLRTMRDDADGDVEALHDHLLDFTGIGDVAASIFLREVQAIWTELRPHVDPRAVDGAEALGLPTDEDDLIGPVDDEDLVRFLCALVRVDLDGDADDVLDAAEE